MASRVLRELLVRLGVDTQAPMTKRQLKDFEDGLTRVKKTMADGVEVAARWSRGIVLAVGAAAAGVTKLTVDMGKQATEIERQARLLNLTTEEYQKWRYVVEGLGGTTADMADSFLQINTAAQDAITGGKAMTEEFARIGIRVDQLKNKNPSQLFDLLAQHVAAATDKGAAMAAVSRLLGEEASRKLGPALVQGADAVKRLKDEAVKLGVVMSDDQLRALKAVGEQWRRLTGLTKGLRNVLAAALAPVVGRLLKSLADWIEANRQLIASGIEKWVERARILLENLNRAVTVIGGWDVVLLQVATGIGMLTLLANLDKVKSLLLGLRIVWAGLGMAAGAAAAATGIAVLPLTLIVLGLVTAVGLLALGLEDLWVWWQGGDSLLKRNLDAVENLIPAFGGLRDLVWALAEAFGSSFTKLGMFKDAVLAGLAPALQLVEPLLDSLLAKFRELSEWWAYGNAIVGSGLSGAADWVRQVTAITDEGAEFGATFAQGQLAGMVQGQVDRVANTTSNIDNSQRTATFNLQNTFGGAGARDVTEALEGTFRRALPALQGGRR
jgi:hypothetical protein